MELSEEILAAVKKDLVGKHAEAMTEFIKKAQENERILKDYKYRFEELNEELVKERTERKRLDELRLKVDDINIRYSKVKQAEEVLILDQLKFSIIKEMDALKVVEANKRADGLYTIVALLSKNPESIKMFNSHMNTMTNATWHNGSENRYVTGEMNTGTEQTKVDKGNAPDPGTVEL